MTKSPRSGSRTPKTRAPADIPAPAPPTAAPAKRMSASSTPSSRGGIHWPNVFTVVSAAVLIGAEVFGAAYAGAWAIANLFQLGDLGAQILQGVFFVGGLAIMASFIRAAQRVEPFSG